LKPGPGHLRLELAQYRELAAFAQFGTDMDASTRRQIERGKRMTELLKQPQYSPLPVAREILVIYAGINGFLDRVPVEDCGRYAEEFLDFVARQHPEVPAELTEKKKLDEELEKKIKAALEEFAAGFRASAEVEVVEETAEEEGEEQVEEVGESEAPQEEKNKQV